MVVKFAQAETKNIEAKCAADKLECRVRDLLKEKEFISNKMRAAMAEKQKAVTALEVKVEFKVQMMCVVLALQNCWSFVIFSISVEFILPAVAYW